MFQQLNRTSSKSSNVNFPLDATVATTKSNNVNFSLESSGATKKRTIRLSTLPASDDQPQTVVSSSPISTELLLQVRKDVIEALCKSPINSSYTKLLENVFKLVSEKGIQAAFLNNEDFLALLSGVIRGDFEKEKSLQYLIDVENNNHNESKCIEDGESSNSHIGEILSYCHSCGQKIVESEQFNDFRGTPGSVPRSNIYPVLVYFVPIVCVVLLGLKLMTGDNSLDLLGRQLILVGLKDRLSKM